jgi:hypothetical protein
MANEVHSEADSYPPTNEALTKFPWTLEIALSGGGLRASAYALGALLYLTHAGLNEQVRNIASLSGGSITNAFVAGACDFPNTDIDKFKEHASVLARITARDGLYNRWQTFVFCAFGILTPILSFMAATNLPTSAVAVIHLRCRDRPCHLALSRRRHQFVASFCFV